MVARCQCATQIGVKAFKRALPPMNDRRLGTSPRRHVGKFRGDIPAHDEHDLLRQRVEMEKLLAGREVFLAGNAQGLWTGAGRQNETAAGQRLIPDLNCSWLDELRRPMEGHNASFLEPLLPIFWDGVGECALESHERWPIEMHVLPSNASALNALVPIRQFGDPHQDLLGVTAAERARSPKRSFIDNRHLPSF
jgi:hypothetical protein